MTNREWQGAAAGTPDPGTDNGTTDCAVGANGPTATGSWAACRSSWGVFDMVGGVGKGLPIGVIVHRIAQIGQAKTGIAGGDYSCFGGPGDSDGFPSRSIPGALIRGGSWTDGVIAGVFAVDVSNVPTIPSSIIGFRCAR